MAELNDIQKYRTRQRKKNIIRNILLAALLVLACVGGFYLVGYVKDTVFDGSSHVYPINLSGEMPLALERMDNSFVFLSEKKVTVRKANSGKELLCVPHGMTNPSIKADRSRAMLYDQGGTSFEVFTKTNLVFKKQTESQIVLGEISGGLTGVVTLDTKYASILTIYDSSGGVKYTWSPSEGKITALALDSNQKGCKVAVATGAEGQLKSVVYSLNFEKGKEEFAVALSDVVTISLTQKSDGGVGAVCDNGYYLLSKTGEQKAFFPFDQDLLNYSDSNGDAVLLLGNHNVQNAEQILVIGNDGTKKAAANINEKILDLERKDNSLYLLTREHAICYNLSLEETGRIETDTDSKWMTGVGNNLYVVGTAEINKFAMNHS